MKRLAGVAALLSVCACSPPPLRTASTPAPGANLFDVLADAARSRRPVRWDSCSKRFGGWALLIFGVHGEGGDYYEFSNYAQVLHVPVAAPASELASRMRDAAPGEDRRAIGALPALAPGPFATFRPDLAPDAILHDPASSICDDRTAPSTVSAAKP